MAFVWVRYPRLVAGANTDSFYMYYGNLTAADGSDSSSTYDRNQVLVYHYGDPDGVPRDQTAYGNNPSRYGADGAPASLIGSGARFTGRGTVDVPAAPSLRLIPDQGMTATTWVRLEQAQQDAYVFELRDGSRGSLVLGIAGTQPYVRYRGPDGAAVEVTARGLSIDPGSWHQVGFTAGDGRLALLVDGVEVDSRSARLLELGGSLTLGGAAGGGNRLIGALLDETQLSNTLRDPAWIQAQFANQAEFSAMVIYGRTARARAPRRPSTPSPSPRRTSRARS
jgi:biopolymer transport protein ExbB